MRNLLVVAIMLFFPCLAIAEPSPFGLEIGKATISDVKAKYKAKSVGINQYSNGEMYDLDVSGISFDSLQSCRIIFSKDGKLLAVLTTLPKDKFDYLFKTLKGKYRLVNSNIPFVGDKTAKFLDGNTEVTLDAPHLSFTMEMNYIHKELMKTYKDQSSKEQQKKKQKEASQL